MITRNRIYFGTRDVMQWLRAPDANYDGSPVGWDGNVAQFLNGGAYVRNSVASHRTYNYSWNMMTRDEIRQIMDYSDGVYGDGPFYLLDPFAMDRNLLPQAWATPGLMAYDGINLVGDGATVVDYSNAPGVLTPGAGYPTNGVGFSNVRGDWPAVGARRSIYVPIPEGHTAWFGAHGQAVASSNLAITPDGGKAQNMPVLTTVTQTRFSTSWDGSTTSGLTIGFTGTGASATIQGMMLQILPTGTKPYDGGFISGQGNAGLRFASHPTLTQYSAGLDKVSLTASLIEDETWR